MGATIGGIGMALMERPRSMRAPTVWRAASTAACLVAANLMCARDP
jgi:hypothetical protein